MIKLKDSEHLYYIRNQGCDDSTCGLAIIEDSDFPKFKQIIENLNKNSTYDCMPKISVYKIDGDCIEEYDSEDRMDYEKLYFNNNIYALTIKSWEISDKGEKVI